jgi:hypothetical protein
MEIELYLETAAAIIRLEVDEVFMPHGRKYVCHRPPPFDPFMIRLLPQPTCPAELPQVDPAASNRLQPLQTGMPVLADDDVVVPDDAELEAALAVGLIAALTVKNPSGKTRAARAATRPRLR